MNLFELFGFFVLGSVFNMLLMICFVWILIRNIKNSLESNINILGKMISDNIEKVEKVLNTFKKGGKENGEND